MNISNVKLDRLQPHPKNPRLVLREDVISGIVAGLSGGFHPAHALQVWPSGDVFTILSGHHRAEGAKRAGLDEVPCWIRDDLTEDEAMFEMLRSNIAMTEYTNEEKERAAATAGDMAEQKMRKELGLQPRTRTDRLKNVIRDDDGFVYIIHAIGTDKYKIGMTRRSVDSRLDGIATSSPYKCECVYSIQVPRPRSLEKHLHDVFKQDREAGEWFSLSNESLSKAKAVCNNYDFSGEI